jgi:hypothetical protein
MILWVKISVLKKRFKKGKKKKGNISWESLQCAFGKGINFFSNVFQINIIQDISRYYYSGKGEWGKHLLPCTWKLRQLCMSARLKQIFVVVRYLLWHSPTKKILETIYNAHRNSWVSKADWKTKTNKHICVIDEDGRPYLQDIFHIFLTTHTWNHLHNHLMWL